MNRIPEHILNDYAYCEGKDQEDFIDAVCAGKYDDMTDEEFEKVLVWRKREQALWDAVLKNGNQE